MREMVMSDIVFECPHCGNSLKVDASAAGVEADCPECGQQIEIPAESPAESSVGGTAEEPEPQQQEPSPAGATREDTVPDRTAQPPVVENENITPEQFRELLEETSRSIIPQLEEASAEIRKALG